MKINCGGEDLILYRNVTLFLHFSKYNLPEQIRPHPNYLLLLLTSKGRKEGGVK